ncbi:CBS domain-containing protein [Candidatus Magnetaquicoccus inordinatus]|uniref:CBS domain-containing protein n=1 Tax=Candidatus Magnetaquicoccus inordinatus TaxID=2496818 RepID=UPI00102CB5D9|nr:CBS domain-containing protein [Candidatus Magnetaquicoccus inordinatus]
MKAREFMTREVISVPPDMPIQEVAQLLTERSISGVPVIGPVGLMGIITEGDLVDRVKKIHLPTLVTILDVVIPIAGERRYEDELRKMAGSTAADIMTSEVVVADEEMELADVATLISEEKVALLPVLRGDEVVGIIGKRDIIRAMLADK